MPRSFQSRRRLAPGPQAAFKDLVVLISEFELWPVSFSWRPRGKFSNGGASSTRTEGTWLDFRSGISAFTPGLV